MKISKTLFLAVFFFTFVTYAIAQPKASRVKKVILMIGDGMGVAQIYAGLTANKGHLNLARAHAIGFHKSYSSDRYVTDSAAGATAFACGQKTYNGAIGVDASGMPIPTILELAEQNGLATGLIATCSITHATPASFISHQPSRSLDENIALDFLKTDIDLFIGGGKKHFADRSDKLNLIDSLRENGYSIPIDLADASKLPGGKLALFLADDHQPKISQGRGDQLVQSTTIALQLLGKNKKGMFLMIEGSQIDWGGHENDTQYIVEEVIDFDKAVGKAFDYADMDGQTLVIVTADHETGGLALKGGNINEGKVEGAFTTKGHTGEMIPVFAYGPGATQFTGIYENTAIFDKMMRALRLR